MDLSELFNTFERYAFRLEGLGHYAISGRENRLELFRHGKELPQGFNDHWVAIISAAHSRGARMERFRLVSDPPTLYERYETDAAYKPGVQAGEDIRIASRLEYPFEQDFWAFDDKWFVLMKYGSNGSFIGSESFKMDDSYLKLVQQWRIAWEKAPKIFYK